MSAAHHRSRHLRRERERRWSTCLRDGSASSFLHAAFPSSHECSAGQFPNHVPPWPQQLLPLPHAVQPSLSCFEGGRSSDAASVGLVALARASGTVSGGGARGNAPIVSQARHKSLARRRPGSAEETS